MTKPYDQACPVASALDLFGERWALLLIRDLLRGPKRFQELESSLEGIAPTVLSQRLKDLEGAGIVTRRFYSDHPPRAEYLLTPKGEDLKIVVGALGVWGSRHTGQSSDMLHAACGGPVGVQFTCPTCDVPLSHASDIAKH